MEFQELVGTRRSIRFFDPKRPVEQEKIQKILEALLRASCAVNAHWLRAVVVKRDDIPKDQIEKLKTPVQAVVIELAPVHIYLYADLGVVNRVQGTRLKELFNAGAVSASHGWSPKFVDEIVYPQLLKPMTQSPHYPVMAAFDCGVATCQGLLMAFELGLGACLTAFVAPVIGEIIKPPQEWLPLYALNVGYSLESREAGGQRPRPPFEEQYFLGRYGNPFPRDPKVVEELHKSKLIQAPAPLPGRRDELRKLARQLNLPE
ncbi:MAG TPA: nitroreductase family protein [Candidatus Binataceae bacterium]|nr:nitroreductase family protein [Candidatus Binataceae bacterium]